VLSPKQQGLISFLRSSGLTTEQVARGGGKIEIHPGVNRWKYQFGKPLLPLEVVAELPTQMRRLHDTYIYESSQGMYMLGVKIKDED